MGQNGAALHRRAGLAVHAVFAGDRDLGGAGGGLDVATLEGAVAEQIVAPALMHEMAAAMHAADRIDDRVERLEFDVHRLRDVLRGGARWRDAGGDRLAAIS